MTIAELTEKMIAFTARDSLVVHHDVNHFLKVWAYARTIGVLEGLDPDTQFLLEAAALLHDIACPYCRRTYGSADGKHQESDGEWIARQFMSDTDIPRPLQDRIVFLVSHHHTYTDVTGADWQLLLEADYLVNAEESSYSKENLAKARSTIFSSPSGIRLLDILSSAAE